MKRKPPAAKPPARKRKAKNLTLSDDARLKGEALAGARGIKLSQLVEQLVRAELVRVGKLPPEKG